MALNPHPATNPVSFLKKLFPDAPKAAPAAVETGKSKPSGTTSSRVNVVLGKLDDGEGPNWLCYAAARAKYVTEHLHLYENQAGAVIPTFEEEVTARGVVAEACGQQIQLGQHLRSAYFSDLLRVYRKGFIPQYVWHFLGEPSWAEELRPINMTFFLGWAKIHLNKHVVQTGSGIRIEPRPQRVGMVKPPLPPEVKNAGGTGLQKPVAEAIAAFQQGHPAEAMQKLDALLPAIRAVQPETDATYLCVQSQTELDFFIKSQPLIRSIRILPWHIAEALYARAFILVHEKKFNEALPCLRRLIRLAPLLARGHRELGLVLTHLGKPKDALASHARAWELAGRLPGNASEGGPALRGMAVALIDLRDLEGAEKVLHDSLEVEPASELARRELLYIAKLRNDNKAGNPSYEIR